MRAAARTLTIAVLLSLALLAAFARPAAAATPCWKALLTDWYDGRIDQTYEIHCYSDALKHLPPDVQTYSSAHDDILRALQSAKAKLRKAGQQVTPTTPVAPSGTTKTTKTTKTTSTPTTTTTAGPGGTGGNGGSGRKPNKGLAGAVDSSSPSSLPVPLLVLGGLALLLVAAGAVGLAAKRLQKRR